MKEKGFKNLIRESLLVFVFMVLISGFVGVSRSSAFGMSDNNSGCGCGNQQDNPQGNSYHDQQKGSDQDQFGNSFLSKLSSDDQFRKDFLMRLDNDQQFRSQFLDKIKSAGGKTVEDFSNRFDSDTQFRRNILNRFENDANFRNGILRQLDRLNIDWNY